MPIIENLSSSDYFAADGISKSGLDLIARSPAHFRFAAPREATRAMEIGTAIHMAVLEPSRFSDHYVIVSAPDRRSSAYKAAVDAVGSDRVLLRHEADDVEAMQQAVWANTHAAAFLHDARTELSVFATDPVTGLAVKARFDAMNGARSLDLKKTQDARPAEFGKSVANYRYMVQAAFYSDVWEWETGEKLAAFGFLAVEEKSPNASAIYVLDDDALEYGRRLYRRDLDTCARCVERDEWPSLDGAPQILTLPAWAMKE